MVANQSVLDRLFNERFDYTAACFRHLARLYRLTGFASTVEVTAEQWEYVIQRDFFVLVCAYDQHGRVFFRREMGDSLQWTLPGGSIRRDETHFDTVRRLIGDMLHRNAKIGEVEPISLIENTFSYEGNIHSHIGLGVMCRVRNAEALPLEAGRFVVPTDSDIARLTRVANKSLVNLCRKRLTAFRLRPFDNELEAQQAARWRTSFHENVIKRYLLTKRARKKAEHLALMSELVGDAKLVLDPSAGDSNFLEQLISKNPGIEIAVANDVAYSLGHDSSNADHRVVYTNHDAIYMPFAENTFDVSICQNTLHHMPSRKHLEALLSTLHRVSKRMVVFEIEDPKSQGGFAQLLNEQWYHKFLYDQGYAYWSSPSFRELFSTMFPDDVIEFRTFQSILGRYMVAIVDKSDSATQMAVENMEVERKYRLADNINLDDVRTALSERGYIHLGQSVEEDEYFTDSFGSFIESKVCLRIRSAPSGAGATIDYKGPTAHGDQSSGFAKLETNLKIQIDEIPYWRAVLKALGYSSYVTVSKTRNHFEVPGGADGYSVRVVLDKVDLVGTFAEIEIMARDGADKDHMLEVLNRTSDELKNLFNEEESRPYRDLVATHIASYLKQEEVKAILFDLDGTIVPTEQIFFEAWRTVFVDNFDCDFTQEEYSRLEIDGDQQLLNFLRMDGRATFDISDHDAMRLVYDEYTQRISQKAHEKWFVSWFDAVREIKPMFRTALVTNSRRQFVNTILTSADATELFDVIVCREDVKQRKPNAEPYVMALEQLKMSANECIAVEDSIKGFNSADGAGIRAVMLRNGGSHSSSEAKTLGYPTLENLPQFCFLMKFC